ncbi:hypothetical protein WR25_09248 [Diploscapter pachys]|uniref:glutamine--tRNA ligase n=1 Tax=Diploscapter pachys TaxID=2018661 RepID=A0A2A2M0E3_9BILA|nr:hypothetical protein WR25_09248 [Diploscapter pachys]
MDLSGMEQFLWLGLTEQRAAETAKNKNLTNFAKLVQEAAKQHGAPAELPKPFATLFFTLLPKLKPQMTQNIGLIVKHILSEGIKSEAQLTAACEFLLASTVSAVDEEEFKKACGVGVEVSVDEIEDAVSSVIDKYKKQIVAERYAFNSGKILGELKKQLPWADHKYVKKEVDLRFLELLGPKTAEDLAPKKVKKEESKPANEAAGKKEKLPAQTNGNAAGSEAMNEDGAATIEELMKTKAHFHKVGENYKTDGYVVTPNTKELLQKHVQAVGGKVVTRFPPEPNGVLHIGHAKAININFGYAKATGGACYLRFDDTNPEKEEEKFFLAIEDIVRWLGYSPVAVTHSSDNFQQLYEWAVVLIKKGHAYVCHQKVEEMRGFEVQLSPWRERSVEENLQLFEDMKNGKFDEGEATLRLKMTLEEGKIDPVAYRIKYVPHHRTANKWCIYPTYDYTHCLCDSIENITHSLCTKEFQSRRSSYYWLCNALDIYCPVQWEYGRLNVNYTVVSKRKILKLIQTKVVNDWDDPRLFTLTALRRRGIPSEAINRFVAGLGLTMTQMAVDPHVLDASVRDYLNNTAPRTMAVLQGIKLTIVNFDEMKLPANVQVPDFPSDPQCSKQHTIAFAKEIYIERDDFREDETDKKYRRLTKSQAVGLKYVGVTLKVLEVVKDSHGNAVEVKVTAHELSDSNKPKAFIHWVSNPVKAEARLYENLFLHKNPEDTTAVPGGFLSDINPNNLTVLYNVLIDRSIAASRIYDRFQFERIGFFSVDPDSVHGKRGRGHADVSRDNLNGCFAFAVCAALLQCPIALFNSSLDNPHFFVGMLH